MRALIYILFAFPFLAQAQPGIDQNSSAANRLIWSSFSDTTYTQVSPFSIIDGTIVTLPFVYDTAIESFNRGFSQYSNSDTTFLPRWSRDVTDAQLRFSARTTSVVQNGVLNFTLDIGGTQGEIEGEARPLIRGTDWNNYTVDFSSFNLGTFIANGGKIKVEAVNSNVEMASPFFDADGDGIREQQPMVLFVRNSRW